MYYWPPGVPDNDSVPAFEQAYGMLGFTSPSSRAVEDGVEKVAIYAGPYGKVLHASRQLKNGRWTSKLGREHDIEHALEDLEGGIYGTVVRVLGSERHSDQPPSPQSPIVTRLKLAAKNLIRRVFRVRIGT